MLSLVFQPALLSAQNVMGNYKAELNLNALNVNPISTLKTECVEVIHFQHYPVNCDADKA